MLLKVKSFKTEEKMIKAMYGSIRFTWRLLEVQILRLHPRSSVCRTCLYIEKCFYLSFEMFLVFFFSETFMQIQLFYVSSVEMDIFIPIHIVL